MKTYNKAISQLVIVIFLIVYWLFIWKLERIDYSETLPRSLEQFIQLYPLFSTVIPDMSFVFELLSPRVLRHFIPLIVGWWLARDVITRFMQSFYELPDGRAASSFLTRLTWPTIRRDSPTTVQSVDFDARRQSEPLLRIGGPGRISIPSGESVVTERNGRFRRILGPGTHRLDAFEYPAELVEIRPQERSLTGAELVTADGIKITTDVSVSFRIGLGGELPSREQIYPFNHLAVKQAAYSQIVSEGEIHYWDSLPPAVAVSQLVDIVAEYNLDDLVYSEQSGVHFHHLLSNEMERRTRDILAGLDIHVISSRLGLLELPEAVTDQHIDYWRASWNTQRRFIEAEGQARAIQEKELARAQAEAMMLEAFFEGIQRARQTTHNVDAREILALRLIEVLEMLAQQSQRIVTLPDMLLPLLATLRKQILFESDLDSGAGRRRSLPGN
jgi:regulator of protease activity HflC (stomatin/prohibitin superfamily)